MYVFAAAGTVILVVVVAVVASYLYRAPVVADLQPPRARLGETITITGKNLSPNPARDEVLFGDVAGQVTEASATQLRVVVPTMRLMPGEDTPLSVKVRVSGRPAAPLSLTVYDAPKITRMEPDVAMPGDILEIEGSGWTKESAVVRFGATTGEILSASASRVQVRVPTLDAAPGTSVPVVVAVGTTASAATALLIGRLPLVTEVVPPRASAGDVVRVKGRGFRSELTADQVQIAGVPALVAAANPSELEVVVPRTATTADATAPLAVRVTGLAGIGESTLTLAAGADPIELKMIAEPFVDAAGHPHATLGTELGPAFVLSASGGRSAAERAAEAAKRWSEAVVRLRASLDEALEVRGADTGNPTIALRGRALVVLEVTDEDAAAYNEGWLKASGPPVTKARLAVWWQSVAHDLVLLLVRGRKPEQTPALAPEGKLLVQIFERAQKTGRFGLPREVLNGLKPAERESLRGLALRVPAGVVAAGPAGAGATAEVPGPKLEGTWSGWEEEADRRRRISVTFGGHRGTLTYPAEMGVGVPITEITQQKASVRWSAEIRGGTRYYVGRWDGHKISGTINQEGQTAGSPLGTFEISP